jgi:hypothetical protein
MKSLQTRFNQISQKHPYWSSYTCFAEAITSQQFSQSILHRWFQKLVEKDDYAKNEKKAVLEHLENLTNLPRTTENKAKHHR